MVEDLLDDPEDDEDLVEWDLQLDIDKNAKEKLIEMATAEALHIEEFIAMILENFVEAPEEPDEEAVPGEGTGEDRQDDE